MIRIRIVIASQFNKIFNRDLKISKNSCGAMPKYEKTLSLSAVSSKTPFSFTSPALGERAPISNFSQCGFSASLLPQNAHYISFVLWKILAFSTTVFDELGYEYETSRISSLLKSPYNNVSEFCNEVYQNTSLFFR